MIDPISAFAAISSAATAISSAVKAGKDLSSLSGPIMKYAQAEAELQHGAAVKRDSVLSKLGGVEQNAIEKHFRQEEVRRLRDELRSLFMLYGAPGQWERLQATIAEERKRRQTELRLAQHKRDQLIVYGVSGLIIALGISGFVFWVWWLKTSS